MQTVEIELDEQIISALDRAAQETQTNRVEFIKKAVWNALREARSMTRRKLSDEEVSKMYAEAYGKNPVQPDEFEIDEEQLIEVWKGL